MSRRLVGVLVGALVLELMLLLVAEARVAY